ncbi:MAG: shikimate kinase [Methanomassiliicoccales archaeon]|jgi:shikimate kinase
MRGKAVCHGAATIVNAIATGKGAAFGISLRTWAEVELTSTQGIEVEIEGFEDEDPRLARRCVENVLHTYAKNDGYGAKVKTRSEIPISRGLKSSSAAANAVVIATLKALEVDCEPLEAIRIGTISAIEAGVSVTGAFDDACASYFGGVVVTDNTKDYVVKRDVMRTDLKVVIDVPPFQIRKKDLPLERIRSLRKMVDIAFGCALGGDYLGAMTLNGLCYSSALGLDQTASIEALRKGAQAAGLSGTGPATVILVERKKVDKFVEGFLQRENLIITDIYNGNAREASP